MSRIKGLDQPAVAISRVEMSLMETIGLPLPELNFFRPDTESRPVPGRRDVLALKLPFVLGNPFVESGWRLQRLTLPRGPRSNLAPPVTSSEVGIGFFI